MRPAQESKISWRITFFNFFISNFIGFRLKLTCIGHLRIYSAILRCIEMIGCTSVWPHSVGCDCSLSSDNSIWFSKYCSFVFVAVPIRGRRYADAPNQCIRDRWEIVLNMECTAISNCPNSRANSSNCSHRQRWQSIDRMFVDLFCSTVTTSLTSEICSPFAWPTQWQTVNASCSTRKVFSPSENIKKTRFKIIVKSIKSDNDIL